MDVKKAVRHEFKAHIGSSMRGAWSRGVEQLEHLLADEMKGILQTVNHYFADTLAATRQDRVLHRLKGLELQDGGVHKVDLSVITAVTYLSNK